MDNNSYINWKSWDPKLFGHSSSLEVAYYKDIIQLLRVQSSSKILEVGFGNGSFLGFLKRENYTFEGVESNKLLVDLALNKNFSAFHSMNDIEKNKKYDFIMLFDVIEHIDSEQVEGFLKKLSNHLKDNGKIFMRFPNGASPLGLANQHGDVTHCNIITISKLNYWCYNSNLRVMFSRGDPLPFIFKHNLIKMPSRLFKLLLYSIFERLIRLISNQSKGVLSSNLQVIVTKNNES